MRGDQLAHRREMCKLTETSFRERQHRFARRAVADLLRRLTIRGADPPGEPPSARQYPAAGRVLAATIIAVDPWFIVAQNPQQARLIRTAREVNDHKPEWVIERVKARWRTA